jgi:hypothetical protein
MKEADTRKKIEEDLSGAVKHWGSQMKRWVFVYNVRRGLPPNVLGLLTEQKAKYPQLTIEPLSNDDLWRVLRGLSEQDQVEVMGSSVPGYEDTFGDLMNPSAANGRFVIVQDVLAPIDLRDVVEAMLPYKPFGPPLLVSPAIQGRSFEEAAGYQREIVQRTISASREKLPRFAVFSLAPIPLAVHLGFILTDMVGVDAYQYHRERETWKWPRGVQGDQAISIQGLPTESISEPVDAVVRVSLSDVVDRADSPELSGASAIEIDISVSEPSVHWLRNTDQLSAVTKAFREVLASLRKHVRNLERIHLLYAGPTPGAIVLGTCINPRMNPPVVLYEYDRQATPRYRRALELRS